MTRAVPTLEQLPDVIREGLARLAADAVGTFRPTPLSRLITAHLPWFTTLRQLDAAWAQIARMLGDAGIVGSEGPIAADVLRATYARAVATAAKRNATQHIETRRAKSQPGERARPLDGGDHHETDANAAEPTAGAGNGAQRNTADRNQRPSDEAGTSLHRRAALLNRPTRTR
jgi:hypothetical protein